MIGPAFIKNLIKKLLEHIPRHDIEKLLLKIFIGLWFVTIVMIIILRFTIGTRNDIEKRIIETATAKIPLIKAESEVERYETLISLAKYPEEGEEYTQHLKRDPFSEYKEVVITPAAEYNFVLKSIDRMPLPMVYRGYIELPDAIIGQINWGKATKFVKIGLTLNGYKIHSITKSEIEAIDENGSKIEFKLNKPVLGDELEAVLYDNISKKSFNVHRLSKIGDYKVIDIAPDYVILLCKGEEIKLEKQ